ncbi:MAG: hypothetical protein KDJ47_14960, partial [Hyphomicrobiaceae bacterium]|nr:hypothetical protein [Hyphomicrobiaceae bacterium]
APLSCVLLTPCCAAHEQIAIAVRALEVAMFGAGLRALPVALQTAINVDPVVVQVVWIATQTLRLVYSVLTPFPAHL